MAGAKDRERLESLKGEGHTALNQLELQIVMSHLYHCRHTHTHLDSQVTCHIVT